MDGIIVCRGRRFRLSFWSLGKFRPNLSLKNPEYLLTIRIFRMITIAVFAFALYHPGYGFKDVFGALRGSSSASSEDIQKPEVVEMRPASVETPFLSRKPDVPV